MSFPTTGASMSFPTTGGAGVRATSPSVHQLQQAQGLRGRVPSFSSKAPGQEAPKLRASELLIGNQLFDPTDPAIKQAVLRVLCQDVNGATVEDVSQQVGGGNNCGVWFLKARHEDLVLKLVQSSSGLQGIPSEAQTYIDLWKRHPALVGDASLAFPQRIMRICRDQESHDYDLIVMRRVPGESLASLIQEKWRQGKISEVYSIIEKAGACVGRFHNQYGELHGDLQCMNIFFDEVSGRVSLIDLGDMGGDANSGLDLEQFERSIGLLSSNLGETLKLRGPQFFRMGYAQAGRHSCCRQSSRGSDSTGSLGSVSLGSIGSLGSVSVSSLGLPVATVVVGAQSPRSPPPLAVLAVGAQSPRHPGMARPSGSFVAVPSYGCPSMHSAKRLPLATCISPRPVLTSMPMPHFYGYARPC